MEKEEQAIKDDFSIYNKDDTKNFKSVWDYVVYYKWIINFWFVALPFTVTTIILNMFNMYFQIKLNEGFADGNWLLLALTIYLAFQSAMAIITVFEEPTFLLYHKL
jgi:ABC-type glycerol-3-phosphate transport system permease component